MLAAAKKYLEQHCDPLLQATAQQRKQLFKTRVTPYSQVLVIPAYNESTAFVRHLLQQPFSHCSKLLVIIVINQPSNQHQYITRLNQRLWNYFDTLNQANSEACGIYKLTQCPKKQCDFLCINQTKPGTPNNQGVGYARKLGCDIAIELITQQYINPIWISCTDADSTVPNDYFNTPAFSNNYSVLNYSFSHSFAGNHKSKYQKRTEDANRAYEKSILYYRNGLKYAGSPYAFTTLGSAIAIHPNYYCLVRGFPKKAAGEDFYLLNKLAKLAPVLDIPQVIQLKPRASQRVPFGTGPAVSAILKKGTLIDFDPAVFVHLKEWLCFIPKLHTRLTEHPNEPLAPLNANTQFALKNVKIHLLLEHIAKQSKNGQQTEKMTKDWFDGFKTLKFIHALTLSNYPKKELPQLQSTPLFNRLYAEAL
jgi:hypothetical protein